MPRVSTTPVLGCGPCRPPNGAPYCVAAALGDWYGLRLVGEASGCFDGVGPPRGFNGSGLAPSPSGSDISAAGLGVGFCGVGRDEVAPSWAGISMMLPQSGQRPFFPPLSSGVRSVFPHSEQLNSMGTLLTPGRLSAISYKDRVLVILLPIRGRSQTC